MSLKTICVRSRASWSIGALLLSVSAGAAAPLPITLEVDARDVTQGIQHAHLLIPVRPGPLTLAYPKWIPGEHAPNGPLTQMVSLRITGAGQTIAWRRDSLDAFSFLLEVPKGVTELDVRFDYLSPPKTFRSNYGDSPNVTPHLLILPFNHVILYPRDAAADAIQIKADVQLPEGWKFDDALRPEHIDGGHISLPEVTLATLIDSPLIAGEYFRSVPITQGAGAARLSIVADAPGDLQVPDATVASMHRLVAEATGLFGPGHYREYVWLVSLGDTLDVDGLEHHESTDIRDAEGMFTDPDHRIATRTIPHEYVHSWNGKYRRPDGLVRRNYQQPMVDDLLWVYEGMTRYLGDFVLRARSGLASPEQQRDYLASIAARMDVDRPGRAWRSVADTATALPEYTDAPVEWGPIRRELDYYNEMLLVWLEADTLIREHSHDTHSLDDFCHAFFGGPAGVPAVKRYTRADLVQALHAVAPLDWDAFLRSRVDEINPRAPLQGIEHGGWSLTYDDTPNVYLAAYEKVDASADLSLSLGMWAKDDGAVVDVVHGSPAFTAGVAPLMRLLAIDGHKWSTSAARDAIIRAEKTSQPMELIVESADLVRTLHLDYHAGLRYPHVVRTAGSVDLLSEIMAPKFSGGQ